MMPVALILFCAAICGGYSGFLADLQPSIWCLFAGFSAALAAIAQEKSFRAALVFGAAFALVAALSQYKLNNFKACESRISSGLSTIEGTVEEAVPTLSSGLRLRFRADRGFRLKVFLKDGAARVPVRSGDRIRLIGEAKRFQHALMPGDFDAYWFGVARGYHGRLSVYSPFRVRVLEAQKKVSWWVSVRQKLRERLSSQLTPREAGVVLALMIGDTDYFETDQKQIFQNVGAGHLLAVSGLQISCLSFLFFYLFRFILLLIPSVGRRSRAQAPASILTLLSISAFALFSGGSASAIRAAFMSSVVLLGILLRRDSSLLESFALAGFVSIVMAPQYLLDPSFLFSYLAIFGLLLSGSLMAGILTIPLSAYYFGTIALGGLAANLVLMPLAAFFQTPAIFLATIGLYQPAAWFAGGLESLCEALGDYVGGLLWLMPPTAWQAALWTVILVLAVKKFRLTALALTAVLLFSGYGAKPGGVHITVLPVGQGDSTLFEFPNGKVMLVDGGPREEYLLTALRRKGVKQIDIMALSHPDADHIVGFFRVLDEIRVTEIWHSGFDESSALMAHFLRKARKKGARIFSAAELEEKQQIGDAIISILHPKKFNPKATKNNNSLV
ncbi:MAG: ComEC/Rec2 family competence protein, partial [Deltaproteobacteria bacterium]|nr:ComEC/Rec2 family competence protein [Deltaproteobacteria bacterium]